MSDATWLDSAELAAPLGPSDPQGRFLMRLHQHTASLASCGEDVTAAGSGGGQISAGMLRPVFFSSNDADELLGGLPRAVVLEGGSLLLAWQAAGVKGGADVTFAADAGVYEEERVSLIPAAADAEVAMSL